jgi:hypothetical protein
MPKSKNAPALFELYAKTAREEHDAEVAEEVAEPSVAASRFRATINSVARTIGGSTDEEPPAEESELPSRYAVAVQGGRIHLALTSRAAGLVAFGLLAGACLAFACGSWYGRQRGIEAGQVLAQQSLERAAADDIAEARASQPIEDLFAGIGVSPVAAQGAPAPQPRVEKKPAPVALTARRTPVAETPWVRGHNYLVVQIFRGGAREDALKARDYLARHGVPAEIFGSSKRGSRLIATQGFNRSDATQRKMARRFHDKVKSLGRAYFKSGGRYKLEGFFAALTSDSW